MRWYYSRRGKVHEHGLVEDETLRDMANGGLLSPDDLIWAESSDSGWVQASTLVDLFQATEPEQMKQPEEHVQREKVIPVKANPIDEKPRRSKLLPLLLIIICIVIIYFLLHDNKNNTSGTNKTMPDTETSDSKIE